MKSKERRWLRKGMVVNLAGVNFVVLDIQHAREESVAFMQEHGQPEGDVPVMKLRGKFYAVADVPVSEAQRENVA